MPPSPYPFKTWQYQEGYHQGWWVTVEVYKEWMDEDELMTEAYLSEENARQYAGHPTYDLKGNMAWEAYQKGVDDGVADAVYELFNKRGR